MSRKATPASWKPGQSGNPAGRPGISLPELIRKLAIERKADTKIAESILTGILTGVVPLEKRSIRDREVIIGKDGPLDEKELETLGSYALAPQEWMKLVAYAYPGEKDASKLPNIDDEAEEVARAGVAAAVAEAKRRGVIA